MQAILSHDNIRVQANQEAGTVMVSLPGANPGLFNSFETQVENLGTLIGLLRTALTITTPRTFETLLAGPNNVVPIHVREQAD